MCFATYRTNGQGSIIVIEWADRVASLLPADYLIITLHQIDSPDDALQTEASGRRFEFQARGATSIALLNALRQAVNTHENK